MAHIIEMQLQALYLMSLFALRMDSSNWFLIAPFTYSKTEINKMRQRRHSRIFIIDFELVTLFWKTTV